MDNSKIKIGILYGGTSPERIISIQTATNIIKSINRDKYKIIPIEISKEGRYIFRSIEDVLNNIFSNSNYNLSSVDDYRMIVKTNVKLLINEEIDVMFIALHGINGEDGTIQGFLESLKIPYTGSGVSASALAINKDITKQLYCQNNINTPNWIKISKNSSYPYNYECLKFPVIIKPCCGGSSIGIKFVETEKDLDKAITELLKVEHELLIEEFIDGQEITCGVIGSNKNYKVLKTIEVVHSNKIFGYEEKYNENINVQKFIPARVDDKIINAIEKEALKIHEFLGCKGFSSTDFILDAKNNIHAIETNTIPGLTQKSLVPEAAKESGIEFAEFIDFLINDSLKNYI